MNIKHRKKKKFIIVSILIIFIFILTIGYSSAVTDSLNPDAEMNIIESEDICSDAVFSDMDDDEFKRALYECSLMTLYALTVISDFCDSHRFIAHRRMIMNFAVDEFMYSGEFPDLNEWTTQNNAVDNYRRFCSQMEQTVPTIPVREYTSRNRTRTIHFMFENGTRAHESIVQTARFGTVTDLISEVERVVDDSVTLNALPIPDVEYPTGEFTVLDPIGEIPEILLTMDSENEEITIIFPLLEYGEDEPIIELPEEEDEELSIPDTLASVPLLVYAVAGILIILGILVVVLSKNKEEELEII